MTATKLFRFQTTESRWRVLSRKLVEAHLLGKEDGGIAQVAIRLDDDSKFLFCHHKTNLARFITADVEQEVLLVSKVYGSEQF